MRLLRTITGMEFVQGTIVPWYLGRCHYRPDTDVIVLAPIPLNFLIGWSYEAWWRLRRGPDGLRSRQLEEARTAGLREGLAAGERKALFAYEQAVKMSRYAQ